VLARSDSEGEFGEGRCDPMPLVAIHAEFVVAATEILRERVPGTDRPRRAQPFQDRASAVIEPSGASCHAEKRVFDPMHEPALVRMVLRAGHQGVAEVLAENRVDMAYQAGDRGLGDALGVGVSQVKRVR
jgi:hypothetical protein